MFNKIDSQVERVWRALIITNQTTVTPILFILSGLPGTGKTFLAKRLAERLPSVIITSDFVRMTLSDNHPTYASDESTLVHQVSRIIARRLLISGHRVIYDATNLAEWHREKLYRLADITNAKLVIIQTVAPDNIVRERLLARATNRDPQEYSEANWQIHQKLKTELEPIRRQHLVIDTSQDIERAIQKILRTSR